MAVRDPKEIKRRPVIDRSKYASPEYRARLTAAAEQAMACPEYLEEIKAWEVTVSDGLNEGAR